MGALLSPDGALCLSCGKQRGLLSGLPLCPACAKELVTAPYRPQGLLCPRCKSLLKPGKPCAFCKRISSSIPGRRLSQVSCDILRSSDGPFPRQSAQQCFSPQNQTYSSADSAAAWRFAAKRPSRDPFSGPKNQLEPGGLVYMSRYRPNETETWRRYLSLFPGETRAGSLPRTATAVCAKSPRPAS